MEEASVKQKHLHTKKKPGGNTEVPIPGFLPKYLRYYLAASRKKD
jgi:hypothetical protein